MAYRTNVYRSGECYTVDIYEDGNLLFFSRRQESQEDAQAWADEQVKLHEENKSVSDEDREEAFQDYLDEASERQWEQRGWGIYF